MDAGYYRAWRRAHPEYRAREADRRRARRARMTPEQRRRDRGRRPPVTPVPPLPLLYPGLCHGQAVSFWEDELRLDLAQEAALARLEGRCPDEAVRIYRAREYAWKRITCPLLYPDDPAEWYLT